MERLTSRKQNKTSIKAGPKKVTKAKMVDLTLRTYGINLKKRLIRSNIIFMHVKIIFSVITNLSYVLKILFIL